METINQTIIDRRVESEGVFDSLNLNSSYQYGSALSVCGAAQGALVVDYQRGAEEVSSTVTLKIEFSHDGTDWFQETTSSSPRPGTIRKNHHRHLANVDLKFAVVE